MATQISRPNIGVGAKNFNSSSVSFTQKVSNIKLIEYHKEIDSVYKSLSEKKKSNNNRQNFTKMFQLVEKVLPSALSTADNTEIMEKFIPTYSNIVLHLNDNNDTHLEKHRKKFIDSLGKIKIASIGRRQGVAKIDFNDPSLKKEERSDIFVFDKVQNAYPPGNWLLHLQYVNALCNIQFIPNFESYRGNNLNKLVDLQNNLATEFDMQLTLPPNITSNSNNGENFESQKLFLLNINKSKRLAYHVMLTVGYYMIYIALVTNKIKNLKSQYKKNKTEFNKQLNNLLQDVREFIVVFDKVTDELYDITASDAIYLQSTFNRIQNASVGVTDNVSGCNLNKIFLDTLRTKQSEIKNNTNKNYQNFFNIDPNDQASLTMICNHCQMRFPFENYQTDVGHIFSFMKFLYTTGYFIDIFVGDMLTLIDKVNTSNYEQFYKLFMCGQQLICVKACEVINNKAPEEGSCNRSHDKSGLHQKLPILSYAPLPLNNASYATNKKVLTYQGNGQTTYNMTSYKFEPNEVRTLEQRMLLFKSDRLRSATLSSTYKNREQMEFIRLTLEYNKGFYNFFKFLIPGSGDQIDGIKQPRCNLCLESSKNMRYIYCNKFQKNIYRKNEKPHYENHNTALNMFWICENCNANKGVYLEYGEKPTEQQQQIFELLKQQKALKCFNSPEPANGKVVMLNTSNKNKTIKPKLSKAQQTELSKVGTQCAVKSGYDNTANFMLKALASDMRFSTNLEVPIFNNVKPALTIQTNNSSQNVFMTSNDNVREPNSQDNNEIYYHKNLIILINIFNLILFKRKEYSSNQNNSIVNKFKEYDKNVWLFLYYMFHASRRHNSFSRNKRISIRSTLANDASVILQALILKGKDFFDLWQIINTDNSNKNQLIILNPGSGKNVGMYKQNLARLFNKYITRTDDIKDMLRIFAGLTSIAAYLGLTNNSYNESNYLTVNLPAVNNTNNLKNLLNKGRSIINTLKEEINKKNGPIKPKKYFMRISELNYIKNELSNYINFKNGIQNGSEQMLVNENGSSNGNNNRKMIITLNDNLNKTINYYKTLNPYKEALLEISELNNLTEMNNNGNILKNKNDLNSEFKTLKNKLIKLKIMNGTIERKLTALACKLKLPEYERECTAANVMTRELGKSSLNLESAEQIRQGATIISQMKEGTTSAGNYQNGLNNSLLNITNEGEGTKRPLNNNINKMTNSNANANVNSRARSKKPKY